MSRGDQTSNVLCACCTCGCLTACNSCLQKLCFWCCPHLKTKDQYANIEYEPLRSSKRGVLPSLFPSQKPTPTYRKHSCFHDSEQLPIYSQVGDDDTDFASGVVTHEPRLSEPHSSWDQYQQYPDTPSFEPVPMREFPPRSETESPHGSMEDLGVELGFVDYGPSDSVSSLEHSEDRSIRICRTPEMMLHSELDESDSPLPLHTESLPMSASKIFLPPIHRRSLQVTSQSLHRKPSVHFSLYSDQKHHVLIVHLLKAFHLPTKRAESTCSPFVELYLLPNKTVVEESCVVHQTLCPVFDQTFKFTNMTEENIRKQMLVLRIYINDTQHLVGGVLFPLEGANLFGSANKVDIITFDEEEGSKGNSEGDLLLSLTYHPEAGTLQIVIFEACNLKKQDLIGLANPYVKIITLHQGSRLSKWKTTVKKNTLTPVFNELCLLDISRVDIQDLQIDVMVMDYDRFGRNNQIGSIIFGHDVANKTARNHWNEAINNPNTSCMFWHAIGRLDTSKLRPRSRSRSPSPRRSSRIKSSASDS